MPRLTYCWMEPSGYLAACIAELASRPGVVVSLLTWETHASAPFSATTLQDGRARTLSLAERNDPATVERLVEATNPDVVFFSGWAHRPYTALTRSRKLSRARFILGADTPIRFDWRQRLAPLRIGGLLDRVDAVMVPGERGYQLMRSWGVPERKVARPLYGIDYRLFSSASADRFAPSAQWPKAFCFAGRYVDAKGLDVLLAAYRAYRGSVVDPWPLQTCGTGPHAARLASEPGVSDLGFLQPTDLAATLAGAGAFILPSRYEPWGQVIVEAAAAGLPVICSLACGAAADLVRPFHTGFLVPTGDAGGLAAAMRWMHDHPDRLPEMGRNASIAAAAYSAERWADSHLAVAERLLETPPRA